MPVRQQRNAQTQAEEAEEAPTRAELAATERMQRPRDRESLASATSSTPASPAATPWLDRMFPRHNLSGSRLKNHMKSTSHAVCIVHSDFTHVYSSIEGINCECIAADAVVIVNVMQRSSPSARKLNFE